jgi:glyoxylase-like metal-dependent hydrolase (beta-lactamase superfamily II)
MGQYEARMVGNATLVALQDTWTTVPVSAFFSAVEEGEWEPYLELLDAERSFTLNFGAWLVRSEGRTILLDTGIGVRGGGRFPEPPALPEVLSATGVAPEDVDTVVLSHLHFDHTGWNTVDGDDGSPVPLFPNARHVVQQAEWEYWTASEELRTAANYDATLAPIEAAGLLDLVEGEQDVTSEVVAIPTPGHTPGHVSMVVASGGERAYLIADAAHHRVQVSEPTWSPSADVDTEQASRTRAELFERIEREGALVASGHFDFPGFGTVERVDGSLIFQPST